MPQPADAGTEPPARPAVWSEFLDSELVEEALPGLAELGLDLNLAVAEGRWGDEEIVRVVREAERQGVRVSLWPLLAGDNGYWACESNAGRFSEYVLRLADLVEAEKLPIDTLEIDMEMDRRRLEALLEVAETGNALDVLVFLGQGYDPDAFARAQARYRDLVAELHRRGFRAHLTTLPMVLDDLADGDSTIQDLLDCPVTGIDWDQMSFQVYRTSLASDFGRLLPEGQTVTADVVFDYAATARQYFGDKAGVDLGLIMSLGSSFPGYQAPGPLREDIAAALAAGIAPEHVQVFSLDGLREYQDWPAWIGEIGSQQPIRPEPSASTRTLRETFGALDDY